MSKKTDRGKLRKFQALLDNAVLNYQTQLELMPERRKLYEGDKTIRRPVKGGGAFSGKDPSKVDRSGAYMARYLAKNVVAAGLADRCEIQISYAIGVAQPVSLLVDTFGTGVTSDESIQKLIRDTVDLRPSAIIDKLNLRTPFYRHTASYGHFGSNTVDLPWEQTDLLALRQA